MKIIKKIANADGSLPPIQTWSKDIPPKGYAVCPDEFYEVFYSTDPAGFVNITVENDVITAMEVNQEALDAYLENNPKEETEREPTTGEILNALLGVTDE